MLVSSLEDHGISRATQKEVIIQYLLSGPVVGRENDGAGWPLVDMKPPQQIHQTQPDPITEPSPNSIKNITTEQVPQIKSKKKTKFVKLDMSGPTTAHVYSGPPATTMGRNASSVGPVAVATPPAFSFATITKVCAIYYRCLT